MASTSLARRSRVIGLQAIGFFGMWALTRRSDAATRATTTALTAGWAAAFVMHMVVSARTARPCLGCPRPLSPAFRRRARHATHLVVALALRFKRT
jgi:hypothetical protein